MRTVPVKQSDIVFKHCKMKKCKDEKGSRERSKADQGGVEPPQKAAKAWMALQEATPHPMGNWSCAQQGVCA